MLQKVRHRGYLIILRDGKTDEKCTLPNRPEIVHFSHINILEWVYSHPEIVHFSHINIYVVVIQ